MTVNPDTMPREDELLQAVSSDGSLAVRALVATNLVAEAARRHQTAPTATAALGRTLMGALLLAVGSKDGETTQVQVRGDGEIGQITVIADGRLNVRGFVQNPTAHPPSRKGKLDVATAVGQGLLAVVRYHPSWREPYSGLVSLVSGEIAEDFAHYLLESEQTPSAVALGVFVGADQRVEAAGGYMVQALPGADPATLRRLSHTVESLESPTMLLRSGMGAEAIAKRLLDGLGMASVERAAPRFVCPCDRERIERAVLLLGRKELGEIARRGETVDVVCEFCAVRYSLSPDEIRSLSPDG